MSYRVIKIEENEYRRTYEVHHEHRWWTAHHSLMTDEWLITSANLVRTVNPDTWRGRRIIKECLEYEKRQRRN